MKTARLAGIMFVVVAAMSLTAVSSASAGNPLFRSADGFFGYLILDISGPTTLRTPSNFLIRCEKDLLHGLVFSSLLIGNATLHYLGCTWLLGPGGANGCPVITPGFPAGLIIYNTLHGILGLILPSGHVGILFLPQSTKTLVTLAESTNTAKEVCSEEGSITGNFAGEISPVGTLGTSDKIVVALTNGTQNITDIDLTHGLGLVVPKIVAYTTTAALEQTEEGSYAEVTEVT